MENKLLDILIIDDKIIEIKTIKEILYVNDFRNLRYATKYLLAIEKIEKQEPDVILCDIDLGYHKDGIHLMQEVNKEYSIPFIFITGYSDKETLSRAKTTAPFSFITKPYSEQQVISALYLLMENLTNFQLTEDLTSREMSVLKLLAQGYSTKEIAKILNITFHTVETHRKKLLKKVGVKNTNELIYIAVKNNLI